MQALNAGDTLTDTFTATTIDGTTQPVTITITGANDAAVISGDISGTVTEAGGVNNGTPTATGDLTSADVDNPGDGWQAVAAGAATAKGFGTYALDATGGWTYTLDNSNPDVQALNVGDTLTDRFTVTTIDGTAQLVTLTINGANDAAVITGDITGTVTEAGGVANGTPGTSFVVGNLDAADVDNTSDSWTAIETPTLSDNGYGTVTINAAGQWAYILDDDNATVEALNAGETLTDTFTATTIDGTTQPVTITINGANDAAVISGDITGTVLEAGGVANGTLGNPTATGDLNSADVDDAADAWQAVPAGAATYGTYALDAAGAWTYTLDNSNAGGAGAQCGRYPDRQLHGDHDRRHRTTRHPHHQRRQRRRGDHRRHQRGRRGGRRSGLRHAGVSDRDRRSDFDRGGQPARRVDRGRRGDRQRLWQLHADSGWRLDLHARQQQSHRAGAQRRRDADRHVHRHDHRRHHPAGHHHHQRRQRRGGDQRRHHRDGARGRRGR